MAGHLHADLYAVGVSVSISITEVDGGTAMDSGYSNCCSCISSMVKLSKHLITWAECCAKQLSSCTDCLVEQQRVVAKDPVVVHKQQIRNLTSDTLQVLHVQFRKQLTILSRCC